jgi:hypothetical protein
MRAPRSTLLLVAVALAVPAAAHAGGPQYTPPTPIGTTTMACVVQNVGSKPAEVSFAIRDSGGAFLTGTAFTIAPGTVDGGSLAGMIDSYYCEFSGLGKSVRGYLSTNAGTMFEAAR